MNTPEFVALGYCSNDHLCRIPEIPGDGKIEMTEYRIQGGGPAGDAAVGAARLGSPPPSSRASATIWTDG